MKNSLPAAALASLSIAASSIPAAENAASDCESVKISQCAVREPHAADNRDVELESPTPESVTKNQLPTYYATTGGSITVKR